MCENNPKLIILGAANDSVVCRGYLLISNQTTRCALIALLIHHSHYDDADILITMFIAMANYVLIMMMLIRLGAIKIER